MNKNGYILFAIAGLLYLVFRKGRRGSIELPPPQTFTKYVMSAGSVLYSKKDLSSNTGQVFRGGEIVDLVKDFGNVKQVNYLRQDQKVLTGYIKTVDIRK